MHSVRGRSFAGTSHTTPTLLTPVLRRRMSVGEVLRQTPERRRGIEKVSFTRLCSSSNQNSRGRAGLLTYANATPQRDAACRTSSRASWPSILKNHAEPGEVVPLPPMDRSMCYFTLAPDDRPRRRLVRREKLRPGLPQIGGLAKSLKPAITPTPDLATLEAGKRGHELTTSGS